MKEGWGVCRKRERARETLLEGLFIQCFYIINQTLTYVFSDLVSQSPSSQIIVKVYEEMLLLSGLIW